MAAETQCCSAEIACFQSPAFAVSQLVGMRRTNTSVLDTAGLAWRLANQLQQLLISVNKLVHLRLAAYLGMLIRSKQAVHFHRVTFPALIILP
jgi:hypothetical protein